MLTIPPAHAILDRAADLRRAAQLQRDASAIKALNAIIASVVCDYAVLSWDGAYLAVASESEAGKVHQVSGFGCSCEARRPCWHMRLRDLLLDLFGANCDTADMEADADELPVLRPLGARLAHERRNYAYV